jgi:hypothetical protein
MAIVPSRAKEIERLIRELSADDPRARESAVARLTLAGERALVPLLALLDSASPPTLLAVLPVIEQLEPKAALPRLTALMRHADTRVAERVARLLGVFDDGRVLGPLSQALAHAAPSVRLAALDALASLHERGMVEALGPLVEALLDEAQDSDVRVRALDALASLPRTELRALVRRLQHTDSAPLRRRASALGLTGRPTSVAIGRLIERLESPASVPGRAPTTAAEPAGPAAPEALVGRLERQPLPLPLARRLGLALTHLGPEALDAVQAALTRTQSPLALQVLAGVLAQSGAASSIPRIDAALRRLAARPETRDDAAHAEAAAQLHLALAALGSRIALYDLRERLGRRPALAVPALLQAVEKIGDASLVAPLTALAHEAPGTQDACSSALSSIVRRERLRRSARLLRSIPKAQQPTLAALWPRAPRPKRGQA